MQNYSTNNELVDHLVHSGAIRSINVERAFREVDRKDFVPPILSGSAYADTPLPIGKTQTISQPFIVAVMTELLEVRKELRVLDVGAGSMYQAAILACLAGRKGRVYAIERDEKLVEKALQVIKEKWKKNWAITEIVNGDGSEGLSSKAPFDRIMVAAACPLIPFPLLSQLKEKGVMVLPLQKGVGQELVVVEKQKESRVRDTGIGVQFVPLIGKHGFLN